MCIGVPLAESPRRLSEVLAGMAERERRSAAMVASGATNREIAKALQCSPRTVKAILYRMYVRLGIADSPRLKRVVLARLVLDAAPAARSKGFARLFSAREISILDRVALGYKNGQIAADLESTEHMVKNYLRSIFDRAGCWSRTELAAWWRAHRGNGQSASCSGGSKRKSS